MRPSRRDHQRSATPPPPSTSTRRRRRASTSCSLAATPRRRCETRVRAARPARPRRVIQKCPQAKDVVAPTLLRAAAAGDPSIDLNRTFRRRDRLYSSFVRPKARCLQNEPPPRRRRGRRAHRSQRLGFEPHIENAAPVFRPRVLSRGRRGQTEPPPRRRRGRRAHRSQRLGFEPPIENAGARFSGVARSAADEEAAARRTRTGPPPRR